jgi:hypothetical protein
MPQIITNMLWYAALLQNCKFGVKNLSFLAKTAILCRLGAAFSERRSFFVDFVLIFCQIWSILWRSFANYVIVLNLIIIKDAIKTIWRLCKIDKGVLLIARCNIYILQYLMLSEREHILLSEYVDCITTRTN